MPKGGVQEAWTFPSRDFTKRNGRMMKEKVKEVKKEAERGISYLTKTWGFVARLGAAGNHLIR